MDYNNYFVAGPTAPQPYNLLSFPPHAGFVSQNQPIVDIGIANEPVNGNVFLHSTCDFSLFDASLGNTGLSQLPSALPSPTLEAPYVPLNGLLDNNTSVELDNELRERRSSSEEKDNPTPAQSRRKAQNRAAQRAFRERKERRVRELEAKLSHLSSTTTSLESDNKRLKRLLQRAQTENEVLRASSASSPTNSALATVDDAGLDLSPAALSEESNFDATAASNGMSKKSKYDTARDRGVAVRMLSASATWDLLQSHPLCQSGSVDVGEVCERLKRLARCEGVGPVFDEEEVRRVIEDVGRSGGDELL
ncbi:hypothetical protein LTR66_011275 [Elasticomyces elasticus]|nr:hypothetical protein LTR66_011275 [Elasticomyces elasticus]